MAAMDKPHSPACDRNRDPILTVLKDQFANRRAVLEVGSGTGQHAVYFARALPHLQWQTSDVAENLPGICAWLNDEELTNTPDPLVLDVNAEWPARKYDAAFSANTLHIMSWQEVERLFVRLDRALADDATLAIYGPFNYEGAFTSASNATFNESLRQRAPHMGIRDFEAVNALAAAIGLRLIADLAMPANNRILIWRRP